MSQVVEESTSRGWWKSTRVQTLLQVTIQTRNLDTQVKKKKKKERKFAWFTWFSWTMGKNHSVINTFITAFRS